MRIEICIIIYNCGKLKYLTMPLNCTLKMAKMTHFIMFTTILKFIIYKTKHIITLLVNYMLYKLYLSLDI